MGAYTGEELHRMDLMRRQERADWDREAEHWNAVGEGHSFTETEYWVYYQLRGKPSWFAASPFYEPLSTHPEWTHDKDRAHEIADLILAGEWPVTKQSVAGDRDIVGVRVTEVVSTTKITKQRHRST